MMVSSQFRIQRTPRRILALILLLLGVSATVSSALSFDSPTTLYLPLVAQRYDPAWEWQPVQVFTLNPHPNTLHPLLLSIDTTGNPLLVFDTLDGQEFIYYSYPTAQGWMTPTQIANTLGDSRTLFPPVRDNQGIFHLLWANWLGSGVAQPYRLIYASLANGVWSPEEEVTRVESDIQGMVRPDPNGILHVTSSIGYFGAQVQHTTRTPLGWSTPVEIDPAHSLSWIWPDYLGGVHFYGDELFSQENVFYSYWISGEFDVENVRFPGNISTSDTQLDGRNHLHIFRRAQVAIPGDIVYGVYHRCLTSDLSWTDDQVLSGANDTVGTVVKAEDGQGRVALAWQESITHRVQVRVFDSCTIVHGSEITLPAEYDWELRSAALSPDPDKFCFVARRMYSSEDYLVQCADLD